MSSWKFVQYSILDNDGLKITEARATPPCNFISIRRLVKTADGDPAIESFGPNLKKLGYEPQNPPLVLSEDIRHRSSKPLLALVDTGVNYNLPIVQEHLALNSEDNLLGMIFGMTMTDLSIKTLAEIFFSHYIMARLFSAY